MLKWRSSGRNTKQAPKVTPGVGEELGGGGGGGAYFTKLLVRDPACNEEKWTQSDLSFCENEESKRFENNGKGGQQDQTSRRNVVKNYSKL